MVDSRNERQIFKIVLGAFCFYLEVDSRDVDKKCRERDTGDNMQQRTLWSCGTLPNHSATGRPEIEIHDAIIVSFFLGLQLKETLSTPS